MCPMRPSNTIARFAKVSPEIQQGRFPGLTYIHNVFRLVVLQEIFTMSSASPSGLTTLSFSPFVCFFCSFSICFFLFQSFVLWQAPLVTSLVSSRSIRDKQPVVVHPIYSSNIFHPQTTYTMVSTRTLTALLCTVVPLTWAYPSMIEARDDHPFMAPSPNDRKCRAGPFGPLKSTGITLTSLPYQQAEAPAP